MVGREGSAGGNVMLGMASPGNGIAGNPGSVGSPGSVGREGSAGGNVMLGIANPGNGMGGKAQFDISHCQ